MRTATYPSQNTRSFLEQALVALLLGFALFVTFVLLFIVGAQVWFAGRIFPGVRVGGISVDGLTPAAATALINENITFPQTGRILLQDGQNGWVAKPQEVGLFLDPGASAQAAFKIGRQGGLFQRLSTQFDAWYRKTSIPPTLVFDQRLAYQYLTNIGSQINRSVVEASLSIDGTNVVVRSGEVGRTLDVDASLALLSTQVQSLQDGLVPLVVKETAPIILDASAQAEVARQILSQPLTLTLPEGMSAEGAPWVFDQNMLAGLLTVERVKDSVSETYQVGINNQTMLGFLTNLAPDLQTYPVNARFIFNDDTHQLDLLENAVIGRTLNVEASLRAIHDGLQNGQHEVQLAFDTIEPPATDTATAESLGISESVSVQTSYFYGSSKERVQNIQAAASRFHGLLIAPGETFSMATALGDISLDNGYAEALIIVGNQTIKGVGGGVCQVSTTLFRTAFFGGFPVVERHAHAYRVYYYEKVYGNKIDTSLAGLDATVFVPLVDFKFTNDTPYWLLMETYVSPSNSSITWKFYSTSDGRSVEWNTTGVTDTVEPPEPLYRENPDLAQGEIKQVDWEAQGADVVVNRTVYRDGNVYFSDVFRTHYLPWQAVYEYGPGTDINGEGGSQ